MGIFQKILVEYLEILEINMNTREDAIAVIDFLNENNFPAYLAGGAVRDQILGREPKDWDVATVATPEQIKNIWPRKILLEGEKHGVVRLEGNGHYVDVATFRKDGDYIDGRRPESVHFTHDIEDDAARRDFTMNAMYQTSEGKVLDFHGGVNDIKNKVIVAVGDCDQKFREDRLRILRATRFSCELGFSLDSKVIGAAFRESKGILEISWERIRDEFLKILATDNAEKGIYLMALSGVLESILPEVFCLVNVPQDTIHHPEGNVWQHTRKVLMILVDENADVETRFAGLLHDIAKTCCRQDWVDDQGRERISNKGHDVEGAVMARAVCERFKMSNTQTTKITELVRLHMKAHGLSQMGRSKQIEWLRSPFIHEQILLQHADGFSTGDITKSQRKAYAAAMELLKPIVETAPLISGKDLIADGHAAGPHFQEILKTVREHQDRGSVTNKSQALELAKNLVDLPRA